MPIPALRNALVRTPEGLIHLTVHDGRRTLDYGPCNLDDVRGQEKEITKREAEGAAHDFLCLHCFPQGILILPQDASAVLQPMEWAPDAEPPRT